MTPLNFLRPVASVLLCGFLFGCQLSKYFASKLDRTFYTYDTNGPVKLNEYDIREQSWNSFAVLIQHCEDKSPDMNGGGDVPCWPANDTPSWDKLAAAVDALPSYRLTTGFHLWYPYLNPELGTGASVVIGIHPLAIAFLDVPREAFVSDYLLTVQQQSQDEVRQSLAGSTAIIVASHQRLLALPTDHNLDDSVTRLIVYPLEMQFDRNDRITGMTAKHFTAQLYNFDSRATVRELLPMVGSPAALKDRAASSITVPVTGLGGR